MREEEVLLGPGEDECPIKRSDRRTKIRREQDLFVRELLDVDSILESAFLRGDFKSES
jgi:hypothetical protein